MTIFIGADHRGFELKAKIVLFLRAQGHEVIDVGTYVPEPPCDYPKLSLAVALNVTKHKNSRGILLCLTGIGHSIAANKVPGAYAALCHSREVAVLSRQHNNANVLVLGSNFIAEKEMMEIIKVWLSTDFEGGRHLRRVKQVKAIEKRFLKSKE
ncbi:MAG: ribose 5-phosphate isomerase B [Candidatus Omnitrophica bacterium]|nr:ribose 5-phosphate isomerase B [Candidatus Omnitrophota bacterium]